MLNISALNQYYDGSHTLHDASLDVADGACTGDRLPANNIKALISR
ncbi:hypothetical protein [Pararobbsia alpina]|nr:hypothetical protein [Pararobbsia alpina]